ncbi:MAG: alpha/beta fold hydrolase [Rhizobiaceae bacterium]|nr:MAG: alpha/beta fold hydrolase [Rhizobiaceae bacterium]
MLETNHWPWPVQAERSRAAAPAGKEGLPMILPHRVEGSGDGLAVLMVHPLGADQTFWDECRKHFGPGILTVSCDLRGSGNSPDLAEPLTLDSTVDDLETLRQYLGLERLAVMGCAVGAMAATAYAARYGGRTAALVASNPGFRVTPEGAANLRERSELVRSSSMAALLPGAIENAFVGFADTRARHDYEARFLRQRPENYAFAALGAAEADISGCGAAISCPVLLVVGRNDRLFGIAHATPMATAIPQAELVEFPEGAHFIPYQQPREFGATVSAFLTRNGLARQR